MWHIDKTFFKKEKKISLDFPMLTKGKSQIKNTVNTYVLQLQIFQSADT